MGFCSGVCEGDVECLLGGDYAGCEAVPGCLMNQCVYECGADYQCPHPMACVWSEVIQRAIGL